MLAAVGFVLAVVSIAASAWLVLRALAAGPLPSAQLAELQGKVESLFKLRLEWNEVLAELEELTETVERRRKRAAASAARSAPQTPQEPADPFAGLSPSEVRAELRRRAVATGRL